jgi:membrane glycosyltransferase
VLWAGVLYVVTAPLWFLFLIPGMVAWALISICEPQYFVEPRQLFPIWPQWHPDKAIALFSTTFVLLFLPKALGLLRVWFRDPQDYGGRIKALQSMLGEVLFSMLLAPVRMIFHTRFVVGALFGLKAKWISPQREAEDTPWSEAIRRHSSQTLLGIAWAALVGWLNPVFLWWMVPILAAWLLIIPLSVYSSRLGPGRKSIEKGLFRIPEETCPPEELTDTQAYTRESRSHEDQAPTFDAAISDPVVNALVCAMGTARHRPVPANLAARKTLVDLAAETPTGLTEPQRLKLLDDPIAMAQLHRLAWVNGAMPVVAPRKALLAVAA